MSLVRIASIPIRLWGLGILGFDHLVLTFEPGHSVNQWHWYGIEAGRVVFAGMTEPVLQVVGTHGRTTLAALNILQDGTTDRIPTPSELVSIIGTPAQRNSRIVPFTDPQAAWRTMARFAKKIDAENFPYTGYALPFTANATLNSTSLVASLLHYAGANIDKNLPRSSRFAPGRRTLLGTEDDNEMRIQNGFNALFGGAGKDKFFGTGDLTQTQKFFGGKGDDVFNWSKGHNVYHGGQKGLLYELDGVDTVVYDGVGPIYIRRPSNPHVPHFNARFAVDHSFGEDWLLSVERLEWRNKNDFIRTGPDVDIIKEGLDLDMGEEQPHGPGADRGDVIDFSEIQSGLLMNATNADAMLVQVSQEDEKGLWLENAEWIVGSSGDDRIYLSKSTRGTEGGDGDDLIDARLAANGASDEVDARATRLDGGQGNDTIVSSTGRTRASGGEGVDTFVLSSTTGQSAGTRAVEFIIDDAEPKDRLLLPLNFLTGSDGGRFENSPLVEVTGVFKCGWQTLSRAKHLRLRQAHGPGHNDRNQSHHRPDTFVSIAINIEHSDLLIRFARHAPDHAASSHASTTVQRSDEATSDPIVSITRIRVRNFEPGDLGIKFGRMGERGTADAGLSLGRRLDPLPRRPEALATNPNRKQQAPQTGTWVAMLTKLRSMIDPYLSRKTAR